MTRGLFCRPTVPIFVAPLAFPISILPWRRGRFAPWVSVIVSTVAVVSSPVVPSIISPVAVAVTAVAVAVVIVAIFPPATVSVASATTAVSHVFTRGGGMGPVGNGIVHTTTASVQFLR